MASADNRRLVNAVLTNIARGYKDPAFIGLEIAPLVPCEKLKNTYAVYGMEDFRLPGIDRSPTGSTAKMDVSNDKGDLTLREKAIAIRVPWEDNEEATLPVQPKLRAPRTAMKVIFRTHEKDVADKVFAAATYPTGSKVALTGNDRWDAAHDDSDPIGDIATGRAKVASLIGIEPNVMGIGQEVYEALKQHTKILARMANTSDKVVTTDLLARVFEVEKVLVGRALYTADDTTLTRIWGKHCGLWYVPTQQNASDGEPAFAYTFHRSGYPQTDEWSDRDSTCDFFRTRHKYVVEVTGAAAGYFIQDVVS